MSLKDDPRHVCSLSRTPRVTRSPSRGMSWAAGSTESSAGPNAKARCTPATSTAPSMHNKELYKERMPTVSSELTAVAGLPLPNGILRFFLSA